MFFLFFVAFLLCCEVVSDYLNKKAAAIKYNIKISSNSTQGLNLAADNMHTINAYEI